MLLALALPLVQTLLPVPGRQHAYPPSCGEVAAGTYGEAVAGAGTLAPAQYETQAVAIVRADGTPASVFATSIAGANRNQGVFVHDGSGAPRKIVKGCGARGGNGSTGVCGDATPIGGTFSGLFMGPSFLPAASSAGDVVFLSDVVGGSAPRGLFVWREATETYEKVAAIGDPSPLGGTFVQLGAGTLSESGAVVFHAGTSPGIVQSDLFLWDGASLAVVASIGGAAPGGSTYQTLVSGVAAFVDGTTAPAGWRPDIGASDDVVFVASTADGRHGIVRRTAAGSSTWLARDQEPAPGGGTFTGFQSVSLAASGEIVFVAVVSGGPGGIFAGTPGSWRRLLGAGDALLGGSIVVVLLAPSPMTPLDDQGNVILAALVDHGGSVLTHLVVVAPDGAVTEIARTGDPSPLGGTIAGLAAWPSLTSAGALFSEVTASDVLVSHYLVEPCPSASATFRNGSGANAPCFQAAPPVLGAPWTMTVDASGHPGATATAVYARAAPFAGLFLPAGEVLIHPASAFLFKSIVAGGGVVVHGGAIPPSPALAGVGASLQAAIVGGGAELCNAVDIVLGY